MVHGDPVCQQCRANPSHRLSCGHGCCYKHFTECPEEFVGFCAACTTESQLICQLPPRTPRILPADLAWNLVRSAVSLPAASFGMDFSGRGASGGGQPPLREENNHTPTPSGTAHGNNVPGGLSARHIPPAMRLPEELPVRPESSMSNNTILSQLPEPHQTNSSRNAHTASTPRGMTGDRTGFTPRGQYSYAQTQLSESITSADPFVNHVASALRHGTFYAAGQNNATQSSHAAPNAWASPPPFIRFAGSTSMPSTVQRRQTYTTLTPAMNNSATSFASPSVAPSAASFVPSEASTGHDSAAANGFGINLSHAANLARAIRSGATDNPNDPDYGNPGRSKRLPPEPSNNISLNPQPRGKVVASDSKSLTIYESEPNTKGNAAAYLGTANEEPPRWFYKLNSGYKPTLAEVYSALPVAEACRVAKPSSAGVVKITNIPYACDRKEIVAFLGRAAQINTMPDSSTYHAVHIMIDRGTGKTLDAYVELKHAKEAITVSKQFEARLQAGRHAKIGDREVKVAIISQGELMAELFPYGKNLVWDHNGVPIISTEREEYYPGVPSQGFNGFLTNEELMHMAKFAETPQRSPFMQRCLIRGYEHLISVLHKYPWFAIEHVLIRERDHLFDTTVRNVRALMGLLRKTQHQPRRDSTLPTTNTLQELVVAALTCPGFAEGQKFMILRNLDEGGFGHLCHSRGMNFRFGGTSRFSLDWPFFALVKPPGVSDDMVEYVAHLMREATENSANLSLADLHAMRASNMRPALFGRLSIDTSGVTTMADLGRAELRAIEEVLGRVLHRGHDSLGSRLAALAL